MKKTLFLLVSLFTLTSYAQITYDKGYFIDDGNNKIECLIKNYNWDSNPTKIEYKLTDNSESITKDISSLKEFGINNYSRYVRADVKIDRSISDLSSFSNSGTPIWSIETLFLNEILCGKANLWVYTESNRTWFFYSLGNEVPQQLIYKEYTIDGNIYANEGFKQQLSVFIKNDYTKNIDVNDIKYDKKSLINYFRKYNSMEEYCTKTDFKKIKRNVWNLKVFGAVNFNKLEIYYTSGLGDKVTEDYGRKTNWSAGLEFEYYLPVNRNQFSLFLSPTYEHIYFKKDFNGNTKFFQNQIIDFTLGGRYTKYIGKTINCNFDVALNPPFDVNFNGKYTFSKYLTITPNPEINFIIGAGVSYKNIGLEFKYYTDREMLSYQTDIGSRFSKTFVSLYYKIFNYKSK